MHKPVRIAVFPVAGMGTRFLPATKASPKEMLPVVDKPLIQYAAEEAVKAGAEILVFITGRNKRAIEDHFDTAYELETELAQRGKDEQLEMVRNIVPKGVTCVHVRQQEALGLGHAVLCAKDVIGDEPFFVILADDLITSNGDNVLQQMRADYEANGHSVIGVQEIAAEDSRKYGVVSPASKPDGEGAVDISGIVEKPEPQDAPSNLGVVGRYILTPKIFELLENTPRGAGNEIQLTDAIASLLDHEAVRALPFSGKRYDCGSKLGFLEATVELALQHDGLKDEFREYLKDYVGKL
ncbi:MAG: UTP--glucose-1-phosphate uridylyltransferase GalU [Gammaproteobacteria bacterium]|nr:UTP--glucose-1-phosphate uridylyltransferase GalU [Gammaproteobacteria bacterium]